MAANLDKFRGVIRGKIIELEVDPGLPDGDSVEIQLRRKLPPGEGLCRSFGAWAEEGLTQEQLLEEIYEIRYGGKPPEKPS